jgi:hypothetical protein
MSKHASLWAVVAILALAAAAVGIGSAGQTRCGGDCGAMASQTCRMQGPAMTANGACGAGGGCRMATTRHQDQRPLDRGNVVLVSNTCPRSGQTNILLAVKAVSGQPDSGARFVALVDGKTVALAPVALGVYRGQAALSPGAHALRVRVEQGTAVRSVSFRLPVSAASMAGKCANANCPCGDKCQCGAGCKCADGQCNCPTKPAGGCAAGGCQGACGR